MKTALITGASSGIGEALAHEFAKDKIDLVLVARDEEKLNENAAELRTSYGIAVHVIPMDLIPPESAGRLYDAVSSLGLTIDCLVNNAGFGDFAYFADSKLKRQEDMIALNIASLTSLTHYFSRQMKERGYGYIMNVASDAAFRPGPKLAVYSASKAYVLSFSEAIAEELKQFGVQVSALCPGATQSQFGQAAGFEVSDDGNNSPFPTSEVVARFAFKSMKKGKVVFIHGFKNWLLATAQRFIPRSVSRKMAHAKFK